MNKLPNQLAVFMLFAALLFTACSDMNSTIDQEDLVNSEIQNVQNPVPQWVSQTPGNSITTANGITISATVPSTYCGTSFETTLLAGQNINAGTVIVSNNNHELSITYISTEDWSLHNTSLDIAVELSDIPVNRAGAPQIGLFNHKKSHDENTFQYTYTFKLEELGVEPGQQIFIAAHADIVHPEYGSEGAWGEGDRFTQIGTWAMYFTNTLQECVPEVEAKDFVMFTTDLFLEGNEATWLTGREHANQVCGNYAVDQGIDGNDFRIVYSTQDEDARDFIEYDASRGDRIFDRNNEQVGGEDIWAGEPVILPDLKSWTITATGLDGRFKAPLRGTLEIGSWPICQYCNKMFACASDTDYPFDPLESCWTGTRAVVCMGEL